MSKLGDAIASERQRLGWTSRELARRSGYSASFVCDVQAGRRDLSPAAALRFANLFPDVDSAAWLWLLLSDLWGQPVADVMQQHCCAEPWPSATARAARMGEGA